MIRIRKAAERGHFNFDWLDTWHTFSFGDYFDPQQMGFSHLRVINEDRVSPGAGFPTHSHRDMEIVTYVLSGEIEHKDSMGNRARIRPGEVQRMTAGSGVTHSEYNASPSETLHLLQIWILPSQKNLKPGYEQKTIPPAGQGPRLVASPEGGDGAVRIHQNARIFVWQARPQETLLRPVEKGHMLWLQVARGTADINGQSLVAGDGAAVEKEAELRLKAAPEGAEILLFEFF